MIFVNHSFCSLDSPNVGRGWSPSRSSRPRWSIRSCFNHRFSSSSSFIMMLNISSFRYSPITWRYLWTSIRLFMLKHEHKIMLLLESVMPLSALFFIAEQNFFSLSKYSRRAVPGWSGASSNMTKYFCFLLPLLRSLCSVPCSNGCWRAWVDGWPALSVVDMFANGNVCWCLLMIWFRMKLCPLCPVFGFVLDILKRGPFDSTLI